jgi:CBS domain containing-hemolysin-like protein
MRAPTVICEGTSILNTLEVFKLTPVHMAVVVDHGGSVQGIVTQTDLLEAIAGEMPKPGHNPQPQSATTAAQRWRARFLRARRGNGGP